MDGPLAWFGMHTFWLTDDWSSGLFVKAIKHSRTILTFVLDEDPVHDSLLLKLSDAANW